jgi:hypothetical protein
VGKYVRDRRTSAYELSRKEQLVFMNIARTNKLRLPLQLTDTEPQAYEYIVRCTGGGGGTRDDNDGI